MYFLFIVSNMIIPLIILCIVGRSILMKKNVYEDFIEGAKDGIKVVFEILPTLIGLMFGVSILRESGFLQFIGNKLSLFTDYVGFPGELVPLAIVRLFSSSAATGLALDIFKNYGPDSYIGNLTALMMSSTETVFYTMSVYYMAAKVKKTRWTLVGALICSMAGILASVILAKFVK